MWALAVSLIPAGGVVQPTYLDIMLCCKEYICCVATCFRHTFTHCVALLLLLLLCYTQSQGALSIALEPGAKPFLPFESWQYSLPRYRQYMSELAAVHLALEQALTLALAAPPAVASSDGASSSSSLDEAVADVAGAGGVGTNGSVRVPEQDQQEKQQQHWAVVGRSDAALSAYGALSCFSADSGLWRGHAAQADLAALAELAAARRSAQQQQQQQGRKKAGVEVHASQNAIAYGRYLLQLGRAAAAGTAAAAAAAAVNARAAGSSSSSTLLLEEDEGTAAALKLLAHAYALHIQQQCLGTRIGAAATDHLELMATGLPPAATATYMEYLQHVQEPLQQLVAATDAAGCQLDAAGRQAVLDELPRALKKATLMLAPLATA
jgi:hypothetical protein